MRNTENTTSLYWFGPPESNTLRPVVGVDCFEDCVMLQGVTSSALYWPADEVGSLTPGRLRPGDLSLCYTSCHISSICFRRNPPRSLSCTASLEVVMDQVVWEIFWKVFRRSCGMLTRSVGPTDRSAGPLVGRTHLSRTAVSLVGGDPGVPIVGVLDRQPTKGSTRSR
jgi:hypothetical protein